MPEFVLSPYPGLPSAPGVTVSGEARRAGAKLQLVWRLDDPAGSLALPLPAGNPERRDELWALTCFEFFLTAPERPEYWEFNLAPTGDWNVYRFEGYRTGMREEAAFGVLPFSVTSRAGGWDVSACLDLSALACASAPWQLAVATVLAEPAGRISYWALAHPASQPDFHAPQAFVMYLEAPKA